MYPKISIITCSYNPSILLWQKSLQSIKNQNYPHKNIEHIVMDGGTRNGALDLSRKYNLKIISRPKLAGSDKSMVRMSEGISTAKGEIILILETDNILIGKNWLKEMVEPFIKNKKIIGTFSMYNDYEKNMPTVTKYTALIGVNDPLVYYLGKSEKMPRFLANYTLGDIISENSNFYTVRFTSKNLPTLGDNGHMVRRKIILPEVKNNKKFLHTDAFANLLDKGHDTYGVVKNTIIHHTGSDLINFFKKRTLYKSQFYDKYYDKRSYYVFNPKERKDVFNLIKFIFFSLTFFQTFYFSIKGFLKIREPAWFLHPVACFLAVFFYTRSEIYRKL